MKKMLSISLLGLVAVFSVACDRGESFDVPSSAKVVVRVERDLSLADDSVLRIFASDFVLNKNDKDEIYLTFTCPCYMGRGDMVEDLSPAFLIENNPTLALKLLPGASYQIRERYRKTGETRSYYFPRMK